jgi:hypothetical protein
MSMPSNVTSLSLHRDSGLLAVMCDDLVLRIVDIETRRIVREMSGFRGRVLDAVGFMCNTAQVKDADMDVKTSRRSRRTRGGWLPHLWMALCGRSMFPLVN